MNILVADDELSIRSLVAELLREEGHDVTLAEDGEDALNKFNMQFHDIVFSDIRMPRMSGIELLAEVKELNENTQFIIMTSHASVDNSIAALKKGAFDYILKPFEQLDVVVDAANRAIANLSAIRKQEYLLNTLTRQNNELGNLNAKFRELAIRDGLTGLFNHRHAQERLVEEFDRANEYGRNLSVIFMDLDNFKYYNDTNGHQAGDEVLKQLADLMSGILREADILARWGGEEFVIVLPEADDNQACELAERIRKTVETHDFPFADKQPLGKMSVSVGVSTTVLGETDVEALVKRADDGAYEAKGNGRNRTIYCDGDGTMHAITEAESTA